MAHCRLHRIPASVSYEEDTDYAQGLAHLRAEGVDPQYGDLVQYQSVPEYRNHGRVVFNGRRLIDLDYSRDDYGNLPPEFKVIQELTLPDGTKRRFPIDYWHGSQECVEHNQAVWFDTAPYLDQLRANVRCEQRRKLSSFFIADDGQRYEIVCDCHVEENEEGCDQYGNPLSETFKKKIEALLRGEWLFDEPQMSSVCHRVTHDGRRYRLLVLGNRVEVENLELEWSDRVIESLRQEFIAALEGEEAEFSLIPNTVDRQEGPTLYLLI